MAEGDGNILISGKKFGTLLYENFFQNIDKVPDVSYQAKHSLFGLLCALKCLEPHALHLHCSVLSGLRYWNDIVALVSSRLWLFTYNRYWFLGLTSSHLSLHFFRYSYIALSIIAIFYFSSLYIGGYDHIAYFNLNIGPLGGKGIRFPQGTRYAWFLPLRFNRSHFPSVIISKGVSLGNLGSRSNRSIPG